MLPPTANQRHTPPGLRGFPRGIIQQAEKPALGREVIEAQAPGLQPQPGLRLPDQRLRPRLQVNHPSIGVAVKDSDPPSP